jgi:outer membrane lipoprotein-sorting protein
MNSLSLILPIALLSTLLHFRSAHPGHEVPQAAAESPLNTVLKKMDATAASFRTAQAEFEWDLYEKVIDEVDDIQTGTIYYRRSGKDIEMMADVKKAGSDIKKLKPEPKFVLFSQGKIRMYQPKPDQVTEFDLGKNRADLETYVVLGFGGSGQDLVKTFDVKYVSPETIDGIATAKLELIPKSEKVRNTYKQIFLWIDLERGISVQQQAFQPDGNYRLAKYTSIQVNEKKISDDVFKLKTTGKTQTISPGG